VKRLTVNGDLLPSLPAASSVAAGTNRTECEPFVVDVDLMSTNGSSNVASLGHACTIAKNNQSMNQTGTEFVAESKKYGATESTELVQTKANASRCTFEW
jgi:hypothetical protein